MVSTESINYSLRNLNQRKSRSALTILSIFVGITTIFIFISFGYGLFNYVNGFATGSSADKIIVQARGHGVPGLDDTFKLTDDDLKIIQKTSGIYDATGTSFKVAKITFGDENKFVFITSYDPKEPLILEVSDIEIETGRELKSNDMKKAVLGYNYQIPNKIFTKAVELNDQIEVNDEKIKVIGFFGSVGNPQDDSNIYVANNYMEELYENISYGWIVAAVDTTKIDKVIEDIEKNLRKHRDLKKGNEDFFVQSFQEMLESFSSALNLIVAFIVLIALISVIVSTINTANTMITSVLERYKEIGIIKAIGAKNSEIFAIFLFESGLLGFIAGVIGVLAGYGLTALASAVLTSLGWGFLQPYYSVNLFGGLILFATLTGAISGAFPAWKASKTNVVDALRYE